MEKKTAVVSKDANVEKKPSPIGGVFASIVIPIALIACVLIYMFVFGAPANFEGNDPNNHPLPGNYLGIVYKGGWVVPILLTLNLLVFIFAIERALTISKAKGKGGVAQFVRTISTKLRQRDINGAIAACDNQKGSVANVVKAGLLKYKEMQNEPELLKAEKVAAIQKEIEESTSLELPMLEKNLVIISTIASISTLVGLIGTVLGMIKAFSALATSGAPDSVALANGISEALINTALGITGSTIAIIAYNYFTSKIDELTYGIDEAGFSMVSTFTAEHETPAARPHTV
ncbi:MotA/TolQ/ExbB proton channel family protein [Pontibacter virosus]|uniref:Outer membrane transport energization protein ExbB n=1 Tax=Pontibacter virosus TaxID=1765052 RepID=A0A2U1ASA4_9BACT|nr:MotA/TolQ/ExbB proton channel family protein [Pontibacter virosus]PVY39278.1 outer membrane transport energization protein ExbB [Pontibacter virosus]